jgi:hypothetical protein
MKEDCIERICRLPLDFKKGDKSLFTLATESQFLTYRKQINLSDIGNKIEDKPDLIETWKAYSEDKRTSGGYYFTSKHIGAINDKGKTIFQRDFATDTAACSEYILREVSSILNLRIEPKD